MCLFSAAKHPLGIQSHLQGAVLLVSWEVPSCHDSGYVHRFVVLYCRADTAGGLSVHLLLCVPIAEN